MEFCQIGGDNSELYITHDEYKNGFIAYIQKEIEPINEKKCEMITEYLQKIKCLKCFDVKRLIQDRFGLPFTSLDCRGTYDIISCNNCADGSILYPTYDFCEKSNKKRIRYTKYAKYDDLAISIYHIALENEISIPDWDFIEDESIRQTLTQVNIKGDVKQIVDNIKTVVKAYFADPTSLTSFLENIEFKINQFCLTSKTKKEICRRINGDSSLFIFELEKESKKTEGGFMSFNFNKQTEILNIHFMCIKPKNKAAEAICVNMMNKKVKNMVNTVLHHQQPDNAIKRESRRSY